MWEISTTNWNFSHFCPCETGGRKAHEISICCENCSQGNCSYFDFPLTITTFVSFGQDSGFLLQARLFKVKVSTNFQKILAFEVINILWNCKYFINNITYRWSKHASTEPYCITLHLMRNHLHIYWFRLENKVRICKKTKAYTTCLISYNISSQMKNLKTLALANCFKACIHV